MFLLIFPFYSTYGFPFLHFLSSVCYYYRELMWLYVQRKLNANKSVFVYFKKQKHFDAPETIQYRDYIIEINKGENSPRLIEENRRQQF